jgi:D-alanyl-D-alanine carboxypeptidase
VTRHVLLLFAFACGAATLRAQTPVAQIDALVARTMQARHIPGVAVGVIENGKLTLQRAYGVSNLETETLLTPDSVFELASVTKQFTAAAVVLLVEQGKVALDAPIGTYLDRTPATWAGITVRHLLTHTSGLDNISVPRLQGAVPLRITTAQMFDFLVQQPLRWPVGQNAWYSDAGYFLLGMIIERTSGQSYRAFMQERIFAPLRMTDSSILDKARVLKRRVATYSWRDGQHFNWRRDWDYELPSFFGVFSTLNDLATWDGALRQNAVLQPASREAMWTPARLSNGHFARVLDDLHGFGWHLLNVRGHRAVGHSGASGTYFLRFLDEPLSIVVLTNLDGESGRHHHLLARSVAGIVRPRYAPPHDMTAQAAANPEDLQAVQQVIADIGSRQPSAVMSAAYRAWFDASPGWRAWARSQLGGATSLRLLGHDELGGRAVWGGEPMARLLHFSADVKGRPVYLSVGLTAERTVAQVEFYSN